jgi:hypothetical protein
MLEDDIMATKASGRFVLRLEPGLHAALRRAAAAAGVSLNEYCARKLSAPGSEPTDAAAAIVARAAETAGDGLVGVVAFGSWARGEERPDSDLDILIVVDPRTKLKRSLYRGWDSGDLEVGGLRVEPHIVHLPEPSDRPSSLWLEVAVDGVVLFERGLEASRHLARVRSFIAEGGTRRKWSHGQPYWVEAA